MSRFFALTRRELAAYFFAPVPYLVVFFFMLLLTFFFRAQRYEAANGVEAYVGYDPLFSQLVFLLLVLVPLLTMNTVAEEKSKNTIETLLTAPVSEWQVIGAKWLGTFLFYVVMLLPTLVFYVILRDYGAEIGKPEPGAVAAAYLGALLLGGLYVAIGIFASSITENALLSAFVAFFTMILLMALSIVPGFEPGGRGWGSRIAEYVSQDTHFREFLNGRIALHDVIYFISTTLLFLFFAVRALESRKWR